MLSTLLILPALLVGTSAAAVVPRDRTCTVEFYQRRTQNPFVGGDNTLVCSATLDYGDSREKYSLATECRDMWHAGDHCYTSQLPNHICIHTNGDTDGYLDYGAQRKDFNGDGCTLDKGANIVGDWSSITCTFSCT